MKYYGKAEQAINTIIGPGRALNKRKNIMTETKLIKTNLDYTVLKRKSDITHPHYDIVLLEIDKGKNETEYTTHIHNLENGGIGNGHYFTNIENAGKDFLNRH